MQEKPVRRVDVRRESAQARASMILAQRYLEAKARERAERARTPESGK